MISIIMKTKLRFRTIINNFFLYEITIKLIRRSRKKKKYEYSVNLNFRT